MSSQKFIEEMKVRLLEDRRRLLEDLSRFPHRQGAVKAEGELPKDSESEDESASDVAQFSDNLSLEDELDKALRDIESALKLMEKGTYGVCKYCKQPIDERRLRARPMSSSCINCKKTLTQEV